MTNPNPLRRKNRTALLQLLFQHGPLSKTALAQNSGLSSVTVNAIINELLDAQLLVEIGKTGGNAGRPAGILDFHPQLSTVAGIDVQPKCLSVVTSNLRGEARSQRTLPAEPAYVTESLLNAIDELAQTMPHGPVGHIALSVPAPVNPITLKLLEPNSLPELDLPHIINHCTARGITLLADNDANLAAVAERAYGCARGHTNFGVLVTRDSGIGMGLVLDGRLFQGDDGQAGELALAYWPLNGEPVPIEHLPPREQDIAIAYLVSGNAVTLNLSQLVVYQANPDPNSDLIHRLRQLLPDRIPVCESLVAAEGPVLGALTMAVASHAEQLFTTHPTPAPVPTPSRDASGG
ncbi:ROK family transcriptional regulator [Deinococcus deserti]|uniref:Putative transcriptional regulator, ROK family n=1 Tax=Deinococcus deserti (strain DSM 17065 / CIP 109153 / LMG 22923 / VCD115) TaxID=546414 RepID=C1D3P7_DEIDV|nr:ROK family transcriptional regulator [Deinococcus deserti]ACO48126.1 putative transcriptional regulator, ROK family [Deinococcus deserti VCD115]